MGVLQDVIVQHLTHTPHTWLRLGSCPQRHLCQQQSHHVPRIRPVADNAETQRVATLPAQCRSLRRASECLVGRVMARRWIREKGKCGVRRQSSTSSCLRRPAQPSSIISVSRICTTHLSLSTKPHTPCDESQSFASSTATWTAPGGAAAAAAAATASAATTRTMNIADSATATSAVLAAVAALEAAETSHSPRSAPLKSTPETDGGARRTSASSLLADMLHRRRDIVVPAWTASIQARRRTHQRDGQKERAGDAKHAGVDHATRSSGTRSEIVYHGDDTDATGSRISSADTCSTRIMTVCTSSTSGAMPLRVDCCSRQTTQSTSTDSNDSTMRATTDTTCAATSARQSHVSKLLTAVAPHASMPHNVVASSDPAAATMLVYNIFTRRVVRANAGSICALALLGIYVDRTARELRIADDGAALAQLSEALRAGAVSWPAAWSRGLLFGQIRHLLLHPPVSKQHERAKARQSGVLGSEGGSATRSETAQAGAAAAVQRTATTAANTTTTDSTAVGAVAPTYESVDKSELTTCGGMGANMTKAAADVRATLRHEVEALMRFYYTRYRERQSTGCVLATSPTVTSSADDHNSVAAAAAEAATAAAKEMSHLLLDWHDLTEEQQRVVSFVLQGGYHTYIGGGAGTGKSVLLRVLRQMLLKEGLSVAVTATTGIASCQIGGSTLHHTFGINVHGELTRRRECAAYDVIIIDEVSMLSRSVFETLERHLRRANGVDLPFGGVQMIVCGDFLQLGAIEAASIVTSPLFRRNFAMLRLRQVIRQSENALYAAQLAVLRRGVVPEGLSNSVAFLATEEVWQKQQQSQQRQLQMLQQNTKEKENAHGLLQEQQEEKHGRAAERQIHGTASPNTHIASAAATSPPSSLSSFTQALTRAATTTAEEEMTATQSPSCSVMPMPRYVEGAVNLLPTNAQVALINHRELQRLPGEEITYPALILGPSLLGDWTATYLLRRLVMHRAKETDGTTLSCHRDGNRSNNNRNNGGGAVDEAKRVSASHMSMVHSAVLAFISQYMRTRRATHAPALDAHCIVLYPIFQDAYALRLRLPPDLDDPSRRELLHRLGTLDRFLRVECAQVGVGVGEVLPSAEGLHTAHDEEWLSRSAARSPFARPVTLKLGCRVILRANLAPGLVNGSVGTVIGFEELRPETLPIWPTAAGRRARQGRAAGYANSAHDNNHHSYGEDRKGCGGSSNNYLTPSRHDKAYDGSFSLSQEDCVAAYRTFLVCECGMPVAMVPVVRFDCGRRERIAALMYHAGGSAYTHFYTASIVALPLSLAYAFTVHKVQGLTLIGRVHLELSRMWPCEHLLYVAMSRVRNPEQLSISGFDQALVCAAADCLLFDDSLPSVYEIRVPASLVPATWRRDPQRRKRVLRKRRLMAASVPKRSAQPAHSARRGSRVCGRRTV